MYDLNTVKDRIRCARKSVGLTQEELAAQMCCNRETVTAWENGRNTPTLDSLFQLCKICQCDFGFLVGEYEQKRREVSDVCAVIGLTEKAIDNLLNIKSNSQVGKLFSVENVICLISCNEEAPLWTINYLLEDRKLLQLLYLFFVIEDMGGTSIVENTRSNAIFIELIGIFLNKRNNLKKLLQAIKEENGNAT